MFLRMTTFSCPIATICSVMRGAYLVYPLYTYYIIYKGVRAGRAIFYTPKEPLIARFDAGLRALLARFL